MVSIQGFKRPLAGRGTLFYFSGAPTDTRQPPLVFRFVSAGGWRGDHPAPFAWRLIEPVGKLRYPVLDLVAGRDVEIIPPPEYRRGEGPKPSIAKPFVRIFRPQTAATIPQENDVFDADRVLGNTDTIQGFQERHRANPESVSPLVHRFHVKHMPLSNQGKLRGKPVCVVANVVGHYHLEIRAKDIWKPLAYWMHVIDDPTVTRSVTAQIWCFVDRNVALRNVLTTETYVRLKVVQKFRASQNQRDAIPMFSKGLLRFEWLPKNNWLIGDEAGEEIEDERPDGYWWRQFVTRAEDLIGLIPVAGDIYDFGSIAYMAVTGKQPWTGDRVPRALAIVYGAVALGPISVSQLRRAGVFTRGLPGDLARLSDSAVQAGLEKAVAPEAALRMAAAATDENIQRLRVHLLEVSSKKTSPSAFADYVSRTLADEPDLSTLDKRFEAMSKYTRIGEIFSSPTTLREPLNTEYQAYLARRGVTSDRRPALEWCTRQTSGKNAKLMTDVLGPNFRGHLRVLNGTGLNEVRIRQFEDAANMLSRGGHVDNYEDLVDATPGVSALLERDHVFEQRFLYNNPAFAGFDERATTLAILVPKDEAAFRFMKERDPRLVAEYIHAEKTELMKRLPHGREAEFPLQAIWDVHIDTYRQLGVKVSPNGKSLGANVYTELVASLEHLAEDLRTQAAIHTAKGEHILAGILYQRAQFKKRFDPKDAAFRDERFRQLDWWKNDKS